MSLATRLQPVRCTKARQGIIRASSTIATNMQITRRLEFDAGHRIPNHNSQCKHLHGHRYAIEITLSGDIITAAGASEEGMVMDFSDVKHIAKERVVDVWDHAFLVYRGDKAV